MHDDDATMTLSSKDKTPKSSGWGTDFHYTYPRRYMSTIFGYLPVPLSADDIQPVTEESLQAAERAIDLLLSMLSDRDLRSFLGSHPYVSDQRLNQEIIAIRGVRHALRAILVVSDCPAGCDHKWNSGCKLSCYEEGETR